MARKPHSTHVTCLHSPALLIIPTRSRVALALPEKSAHRCLRANMVAGSGYRTGAKLGDRSAVDVQPVAPSPAWSRRTAPRATQDLRRHPRADGQGPHAIGQHRCFTTR